MEETNPFASSSSIFRPKLNDQDFVELVCEDGEILAKARRTKSNNSLEIRRRPSLLDLYETEYDESSFKKTTNINHNSRKNLLADSQVVPVRESNNFDQQSQRDNVSKSNKRVDDSSTLIDNSLKGNSKTAHFTRSLPDEQSVAVNGRSKRFNFASSSKFSRENSSFCPLRRRKYVEIEEDSAYISTSNLDDESEDDVRTQVTRSKAVFKRRRTSQLHNFSERKRVNEINKRMRVLQELLPNGDKEDKASLLDEAIKYMRTLQFQVQMMSMGTMMLPMPLYSPMAMGMHMGAAPLPQFLPQTLQGHGLAATVNDQNSQMLRFIPNPVTGLVPLETCIPQAQLQALAQVQSQPLVQAQAPVQAQAQLQTPYLLDDAMQFRGFSG